MAEDDENQLVTRPFKFVTGKIEHVLGSVVVLTHG